jgi:tRNA pseudouridine13 synthase
MREVQIDMSPMPYSFPGFSGIDGDFKSCPEDFVVDEELAYEASGEGQHLFVRLEKRGQSMEELLRRIRGSLDLAQSEIGYAGMKDKLAVTRQWFSFPRQVEDRLDRLEGEGISVLGVRPHNHKLKIGHLRGNQFRIVLRNATVGQVDAVKLLLEGLERHGLANMYGSQRFGADFESVRMGYDVVMGRMKVSAMSRMKRRFVISAIQSYLFNQTLRFRFERELVRRVLAGDLMKKRETGGMFITDDPVVEQKRLDAGELVITGPMFGKKMKLPRAEALELEKEVLSGLAMSHHSFDAFHTLGSGTRRPLLFFPSQCGVEEQPEGLVLSFFLPKGCYATVLVREVLKREVW